MSIISIFYAHTPGALILRGAALMGLCGLGSAALMGGAMVMGDLYGPIAGLAMLVLCIVYTAFWLVVSIADILEGVEARRPEAKRAASLGAPRWRVIRFYLTGSTGHFKLKVR